MTDKPKLINFKFSGTSELVLNDPLAVNKNVATNGRLFCVLLTIIALLTGHPALAVLATLPIGASCVGDQLPIGLLRHSFVVAIYSLSAAVALGLLVLSI